MSSPEWLHSPVGQESLESLSRGDPASQLPFIRLFCVEVCTITGASYIRKPLSHSAWTSHLSSGAHQSAVRTAYDQWFRERFPPTLLALLPSPAAVPAPVTALSPAMDVPAPPEAEAISATSMDVDATSAIQAPLQYWPDHDTYGYDSDMEEELLEGGDVTSLVILQQVMASNHDVTIVELPTTSSAPSIIPFAAPTREPVHTPLPPRPAPSFTMKNNQFFSPANGGPSFSFSSSLLQNFTFFCPPPNTDARTPPALGKVDNKFPFISQTFMMLFFWRFLISPTLVRHFFLCFCIAMSHQQTLSNPTPSGDASQLKP